ncbi:MAG TPA: hypothetical protein PLL35_00305 [Candidatus Cloacimonas sp.]|nr:hypothetical protein [Candidatus Cloacimonas sp.]
MKRIYGLLLIGVLLILLSPNLLSDTIKLTNGSVIYGHISREDIDKVIIVDQNGIENSIPRDLILSIDKGLEAKKEVQKVIITLKSGIEVKGSLILDDANSVTIKDETGIEKKIAKSNILDIVIDLDNPNEKPITIQSYEEPETDIETEIVASPAGKTNKFNLGLKIGYQQLNCDILSDRYGKGLVFGGEVILWLHNKYGIGFNMERYSNKSEYDYDDIVRKYEIYITPVTLTAYYKKQSFNYKIIPYFGLGIGQYFLNEEMTDTYWDYYEQWYEASDSETGFHCLCGLQYKILFVEIKYSTMFKSSWGIEGEYDDIGGLNIGGGLRF